MFDPSQDANQVRSTTLRTRGNRTLPDYILQVPRPGPITKRVIDGRQVRGLALFFNVTQRTAVLFRGSDRAIDGVRHISIYRCDNKGQRTVHVDFYYRTC